MQEIPHFNLTVGELEDEENVYCTSLVNDPATQRVIQTFSNQADKLMEDDKEVFKFSQMPSTDEFERIISGVWMMPDTKYFRVENGFEFTVSFSKMELKKALVQYLKNDHANNFDFEHNGSMIEDLVSIEHWIIESKDTLSPVMGYSLADLGYTEEIPLGTVMKTVYIKDKQFFEDMILSGKVLGYSLEGFFKLSQETISTMENTTAQFTKTSKMFKELGLVQSKGTVLTTEGQLSFTSEGITLDTVEVLNGKYKTKTGFSIVLREGKVVDFGFENEAPQVAVESVTVDAQPQTESVTPTQVNVEVPVVEPVVPQVNVEVEPSTTASEVKPEGADSFTELIRDLVNDATIEIKSEIASKDALIKELQDKLALEVTAKETALQSTAIPQVSKVDDSKPVDFSPEKYIVRKKGKDIYYIPKR